MKYKPYIIGLATGIFKINLNGKALSILGKSTLTYMWAGNSLMGSQWMILQLWQPENRKRRSKFISILNLSMILCGSPGIDRMPGAEHGLLNTQDWSEQI